MVRYRLIKEAARHEKAYIGYEVGTKGYTCFDQDIDRVQEIGRYTEERRYD